MTIAEIEGKISHTGQNLSERMEDLLTSDVFSACRYVRANTLLLPFLRRAKGLNNNTLEHVLKEAVKEAHYLFWHRLRKTEPDVLIAIEFSSGYFFLVLVEAKYFSSKSSSPWSEEELEEATAPRDQLAREYKELLDAHIVFHIPKSKVSGRALIYITVHRSIPIDSVEESLKEIGKLVSGEDDINIFWASWFELHPITSQVENTLDWERPIVDDLRRLLERKRLVHFRGFSLVMINSISEGFVYKRKVEKRPVGYGFILAKEAIKTHPIFYSSRPKTREYCWAVPTKQLVGKIYNGGAL